MTTVAISDSGSSRKSFWLIVLLTIAGVIIAGVLAVRMGWIGRAGADSPVTTGSFYRVAPMDLDIKVFKEGELQAVNNIEVLAQVEGLNTITFLVKEGTFVKQGDVLVQFDSSAIKTKIDDTSLDLQMAEAALTTSKEMKEIQESQNSANLEAAKVAVELAKLDVLSYNEGTYKQQLNDANTTKEMAALTLKNTEDDLQQTEKLFAKGFVTAADVKKAELALTTAVAALTKATIALDVLIKYQHPSDLAMKNSALAQSEKKLAYTQRENAASMAQRIADLTQRQESLALLKRRAAHLQEQLDFCTVRAATDGLVVYSSSSDRFAQTQIMEGVQVRERQPLLRLPDTRSMKAVIRVGESMVSRFWVDEKDPMHAFVRLGDGPPLPATVTKISVLVDSSQRWWNPDLREYPVDLTLDQTPAGLKPGMGCKTEVLVKRLPQVLAIPLDTVYTVGSESFVFMKGETDVVPMRIALGEANDTFAQVKEGIQNGSQVLRLQVGQGRLLLEKAGIKVAPPPTPGDTSGKGKYKNKGKRPALPGEGSSHPQAAKAT